jgi:hypothetical protein
MMSMLYCTDIKQSLDFVPFCIRKVTYFLEGGNGL